MTQVIFAIKVTVTMLQHTLFSGTKEFYFIKYYLDSFSGVF